MTLYLYAITRDRFAPFEFEGHRIDFVQAGDVAAAVERTRAAPKLSEAALRTQHAIVMCLAERVDEILPVRFGGSVDHLELERLITSRRESLQAALDLVRGRVQMTIRIRDGALAASRPEVTRPVVASTGTAYLEARRAAVVRPVPPSAASARDAVRHLIRAEHHDSEPRRGVASVYHLIERDSVSEYQRILSGIQPEAPTVTGPWPPFAFAPELWP
jgi:hypothetical protein